MCYRELDAVCSGINYHDVAWDFVEAALRPDEGAEEAERKFGALFGGLTYNELRMALLIYAGNWEVKSIAPRDDFVDVRLAPPSPKITVGREES